MPGPVTSNRVDGGIPKMVLVFVEREVPVQPEDMKCTVLAISDHCLFAIKAKCQKIHIVCYMRRNVSANAPPGNYLAPRFMPIGSLNSRPGHLPDRVQSRCEGGLFVTLTTRETIITAQVGEREYWMEMLR